MVFLDFSLSTAISEGLGIVTSIISFIVENPLLKGLIILGILIPIIFGIVNYFRSR